MLADPKVKIFNEMDGVILEIEDEGTLAKVDITERVFEVVGEINNKTTNMNQKERAEKFLEELTNISRKYGFEVTSEGGATLLKDDEIEQEWIEFGKGLFGDNYEIYED
ncbi:hypothetical protein [Bacillus atrophaeus]|uniref:hypothetical protein n=1 Tax=Bacillus atrophaeus TaxID=1452 RepID=UPI002E1D9359|nr:hypothetical protein [Bacillus atrophaeus]